MRYKEILGREGVTVDPRISVGAGDNLRLLLEPNSGVDTAFMQGGVATVPEANGLVMLASLYYEPLWIFYRDAATLCQINELYGKRIATRQGTLPVEKWLQDLDRVEHAVEHIQAPARFASEAYTLREHIGLVRRALLAKATAEGKGCDYAL